MNVISFSLYGRAHKYVIGMIRNAALAPTIYPGWRVWVYSDLQLSPAITAHLIDLGCTLDVIPDWCPPMLARYLIADFPSVERFIVRDADSRLSQREADAVQEWIQSDRICHVMRDHPAHVLMPGGMIGIQPRRDNWQMPNMERLLRAYVDTIPEAEGYGVDQDFLRAVLWPMFKGSMLQHDCMPGRRNELGAKPWPTPRLDWPRFVGEVVEVDDEGNETFRPGDWEQVPKE